MSAKLQVDIVADARGVGRGVNEADRELGRLGSIGKKAGMAAAAGLAVAGAAAGKFALDSIGAASDVQQSFGALDSVYGKSAERVKRWAEQAADSVGLAKSEYGNLAALVGSQLQAMGTSQGESAKRSKELIGLGADLAATYGGSVSDAVGAVSSLLKGEADPIERYGVSIKAADVNARLAAQGLDGLTGSAGKQAAAQATLQLLTEQTAKAQGAFARESDTLAGQQERLGAKFENLKATLGEKLLPVATKVVTWASEKMLPAAQRLGATLSQRFGPAFSKVGGFIANTLVPAGQRLYTWFVEKIAPGIARSVQPRIDGLRDAFDSVKAAVQRNEPQLRQIGDVLRRVAEFIADKVMPVMGELIGQGFRRMGDVIGATVDVIGGMTSGIGWLIDKIQQLIDWLGRIKVPDIPGLDKLTGLAGKVFTAEGVYSIAPRLIGDAPSFDRRSGWTSASLSSAGWFSAASAGASPSRAGVVIDARMFVTVEGAGLVDELAIAQRLEQIQTRHRQRLGQQVVAAW